MTTTESPLSAAFSHEDWVFYSFQHVSLLFLISKSTGWPKRPSTDLLICGRDTLSQNPTPKTAENLPNYKLSTTHIPTKTVTNILLLMAPKWRIYLATLDIHITRRHDTNDDKLVHCMCFHTGHPLKSPASSCLQLQTVLLKLTLQCFSLDGFGIFCISTKVTWTGNDKHRSYHLKWYKCHNY